MLPEQTLNNMALSELISYSETFSDVPSRVTQALVKEALEAVSELDDMQQEIEGLEAEIGEFHKDYENLYGAMGSIDMELSKIEPDMDKVQKLLDRRY